MPAGQNTQNTSVQMNKTAAIPTMKHTHANGNGNESTYIYIMGKLLRTYHENSS